MTNASLLYIQTIILHQELAEANGQNTIFIATRKNVIFDNNNLLERIAYRTQRTLLLLDLLLGWQGIRRLDIIALTTAINHKIHLYLLANRIASFVIFSYLYYSQSGGPSNGSGNKHPLTVFGVEKGKSFRNGNNIALKRSFLGVWPSEFKKKFSRGLALGVLAALKEECLLKKDGDKTMRIGFGA